MPRYSIVEGEAPVLLAWPERRRAAELYRDEEDVSEDRPRRAALSGIGWEVLVVREDRDLAPDRLRITVDAISRWAGESVSM